VIERRRYADHKVMASLPAPLPTFGGLRRAKAAAPSAATLAANVDAKLRLAQRLRDEDAARRATSIAPPTR
jgi:hypothetical protein